MLYPRRFACGRQSPSKCGSDEGGTSPCFADQAQHGQSTFQRNSHLGRGCQTLLQTNSVNPSITAGALHQMAWRTRFILILATPETR